MSRLYLFTLEVVPLEVGKVYDELPSHLTLMSRFMSCLTPEELTTIVRPLFAETSQVSLSFGATIELGSKKVIAHMVDSPSEQALHENLQGLLVKADVTFQYPQFIGVSHRPHVTKREGAHFASGSQQSASAAYLIEVVDRKRVVQSRITLKAIR